MTIRQKAYRKFLDGDFWKELSARVRAKVGKCQGCESTDRLQCHHKEYPARWEETTEAHLEVLCRDCHRLEHGIGPNEFDVAMRRLKLGIDSSYPGNRNLPTPEDERRIVALCIDDLDRDEVEGMFRRVAGMRIILTSSRMWDSWLKKPAWVTRRKFEWSRQKFDRIKKEVDHVR